MVSYSYLLGSLYYLFLCAQTLSGWTERYREATAQQPLHDSLDTRYIIISVLCHKIDV